MNIVYDYLYPGWRAYDADSYDGATDSPDPITGYGDTQEAALADLMQNIEENC
jgi:hypothetical protein